METGDARHGGVPVIFATALQQAANLRVQRLSGRIRLTADLIMLIVCVCLWCVYSLVDPCGIFSMRSSGGVFPQGKASHDSGITGLVLVELLPFFCPGGDFFCCCGLFNLN